jgi:chorismate mutase/GNAT superfamily N-acetyltransferase
VTPTDLVLRHAGPEDRAAIAEVHLRSRLGAGDTMPPPVHPPEDVLAHFGGMDLELPSREVWVAERDGAVLGYAKVTGEWLDDLYVLPEHQRSGVATALFEVVTAARPDGFCLWVFESNAPARAFYARRGCIELERTGGTGNEERSPDIRVVWPGADPLAYLRRLIDDVDDVIADALLRRTALTRAVQQVKGDGRRDPAREAEIAEHLATVVPVLGPERAARIVDVIITESVAAAQQ